MVRCSQYASHPAGTPGYPLFSFYPRVHHAVRPDKRDPQFIVQRDHRHAPRTDQPRRRDHQRSG